jgi:ABC-type transport system involved in Fe-S cluster assembly fused permease/ATPase subunit
VLSGGEKQRVSLFNDSSPPLWGHERAYSALDGHGETFLSQT